jgi:hypothetical protein
MFSPYTDSREALITRNAAQGLSPERQYYFFKRGRLYADVFIPELRVLLDEIFHHGEAQEGINCSPAVWSAAI